MIPIDQHSITLAKKVAGKFKEDIPVRAGYSAFFPMETTNTLVVSVEVERDNDNIAVDVQRFADGNKNKFTRSTEHNYIPPFYKEDYDFQRDEVYMNTVALGVMDNVSVNQAIAQNALKNVMKNKKKIMRAIRKQQADVLQFGTVELKNGDTIDFRRKAESMVDLAVKWDNPSADPREDFAAAMRFLRDEGNCTSSTINVVMRTDALNALLANPQTVEVLDSRRMDRAKIDMPQFNEATGMAFQGQITAGDFIVNLWTYNEKYRDEDGNNVFYQDRENVVVIPGDFMGKTVFGGLPYLRNVGTKGTMGKAPGVIEKDFLLRSYYDEKTISSTLELTSAPLVVPFTIDKVYTMKVLDTI